MAKRKKSHGKKRRHGRRRRNPGMPPGLLARAGGGFGGGFLSTLIGSKMPGGGIGSTLAKLAIGIGGGLAIGKFSQAAGGAFTAGAFGAIGGDMAARATGGIPATATKKATAKGIAAMAADDEEFMKGLGEEFEAAGIRVEGLGGDGTELMGEDGDMGAGDGTELMGDRMMDAY